MSNKSHIRDIKIIGAHEHNLKHIDVTIPRNSLTVITGLSGSGKSSLAFDTLYAEGQRRYVESLSSYARQFLDQMSKPKVEHIEGLSPAISIEQKTVSKNPRSTVGTVTEIYDYLRVLYANIGLPHCAHCGKALQKQSVQDIVDTVMGWPEGTKVIIYAPVVRGRKGEYKQAFDLARREGYTRVKVDGEVRELEDEIKLNKKLKHDISIVVARLIVADRIRARLTDSVETALRKADGLVTVERLSGEEGKSKKVKGKSKKARGKSAEPGDGEGEASASSSSSASSGVELTFSQSMACPEHGPQIVELSPRMFSFNSPFGACPECKGLGKLSEVDIHRIVPDPELTIRQGAVPLWARAFDENTGRPADPAPKPLSRSQIKAKKESEAKDDAKKKSTAKKESPVKPRRMRKPKRGDDPFRTQWLMSILNHFGIDLDTPWKKLTDAQRDGLLYGSGKEKVSMKYASARGTRFETRKPYMGLVRRIEDMMVKIEGGASRDSVTAYFSESTCPACSGARLKPETLAVTIKGMNISQFCEHSVVGALEFIQAARWTKRETLIGTQAIKEIRDRLQFMRNVGLDYLSLDRGTATLSGGEGQRIRLATQIGSQLVGVLYILDEPSIGLHARDNARLIETLTRLRDLGNTVIVVEHDEATIRAADHVIDLGPGAGRLGGELVGSAPADKLVEIEGSITGDYLAGRRSIPMPAERRKPRADRMLTIRGARQHNLKNLDVEIPLGLLVCVTGVSGSGKSTLVKGILHKRLAAHFHASTQAPGAHDRIEGTEHLDKVIAVDQSPIGRTPRSNPATYTNIFSMIRDLFAILPEARARGYKPGRFSFNVKGGRCETCKGDGMIKIEMHFLPDIFIECEACAGRRFNRETLEVLFKGRSIADVLEMTVEEAVDFFSAIPQVHRRLKTLDDVGLGYIHLGQSATTLSGGEAQRVKLSRELGKRATGKTLYILDEPTTGLHFEDIRKLIEVLDRLVGEGNTVLVIEHNLDVVKCADWVIDLGPEGGDAGGYLVAAGPPEVLMQSASSHTGQSLVESLGGSAQTM